MLRVFLHTASFTPQVFKKCLFFRGLYSPELGLNIQNQIQASFPFWVKGLINYC